MPGPEAGQVGPGEARHVQVFLGPPGWDRDLRVGPWSEPECEAAVAFPLRAPEGDRFPDWRPGGLQVDRSTVVVGSMDGMRSCSLMTFRPAAYQPFSTPRSSFLLGPPQAEAKLTWSIWQALLNAFAWAFTRRGFHRLAEWITAMVLNIEEPTITQSVLALEQPAAWKALESFAEYGDSSLNSTIAELPGSGWLAAEPEATPQTHRLRPWGFPTVSPSHPSVFPHHGIQQITVEFSEESLMIRSHLDLVSTP